MKIEQVYAITWIPATNDVIMIGKAESGQYVLGQRYSDVIGHTEDEVRELMGGKLY